MSLLDQLKDREAGVAPANGGTGHPSWRPAKERSHSEGIEGVIKDVRRIARKPDQVKDNQPTHDDLLIVDAQDGTTWAVWGNVRDLRDRFETLRAEGLLVAGTRIAIRYFGTRKEVAKDGTPYTVHCYAVVAEPGEPRPANESDAVT